MKEQGRLRIGVLGAGPIAQFAHFEACRRARNAELYAVCDVAENLLLLRQNRLPFAVVSINTVITHGPYQQEVIRRVREASE